uniref:Uncharacterized protein n=1 Tax=viral metagenome TaxID=1070528 RepID=A0A6C0EAQ8_9ZZZZ
MASLKLESHDAGVDVPVKCDTLNFGEAKECKLYTKNGMEYGIGYIKDCLKVGVWKYYTKYINGYNFSYIGETNHDEHELKEEIVFRINEFTKAMKYTRTMEPSACSTSYVKEIRCTEKFWKGNVIGVEEDIIYYTNISYTRSVGKLRDGMKFGLWRCCDERDIFICEDFF